MLAFYEGEWSRSGFGKQGKLGKLEGHEGEEIMARIYCMTEESICNKNKVKKTYSVCKHFMWVLGTEVK